MITLQSYLLTFDQTIEFHYDAKGRIHEYAEHLIAYKEDGKTAWADENYLRIYHYTSDTHIDFYNETIEGHDPATWYNLDAKGRIIESNNSYGPNYQYVYDDAGHLVEIKNKYQYEDEEDEKTYASWDKSLVIEWSSYGNLSCSYQRWTSGTKTMTRTPVQYIYNTSYLNPFRAMVVDPTTLGTDISSIIGLTGTHPEYLVTGWRPDGEDEVSTVVQLITDRSNRITGMTRTTRYHKLPGVDGHNDYTFFWNGNAPVLEKNGIPEIN